MTKERKAQRILALDPTTNGFGYVLFEGPELLLDWAVARVSITETERLLQRTVEIVEFYVPEIVVTEDVNRPDPRRSSSCLRFLFGVVQLASEQGITLRCYARHEIRRAFANGVAPTREEIAQAIAERYPELGARLPPPRKPWMSEDIRMSMFDAAALALTYFGSNRV